MSTTAKPYTLYVFVGRDAWMCDFRDAPDAAKVQDLFGTTIIPTPFTTTASFEMVKASIERNPANAGATVAVAPLKPLIGLVQHKI